MTTTLARRKVTRTYCSELDCPRDADRTTVYADRVTGELAEYSHDCGPCSALAFAPDAEPIPGVRAVAVLAGVRELPRVVAPYVED